MRREALLRLGSAALAFAAIGLLAPSFVLLRSSPGVEHRLGRHLAAGALANASLSIVMLIVALGPLRRGERWALWVFVVPLVVYGLPILFLDSTHVAPERVVRTIAPQLAGLGALVVGIIAAWLGMARKE